MQELCTQSLTYHLHVGRDGCPILMRVRQTVASKGRSRQDVALKGRLRQNVASKRCVKNYSSRHRKCCIKKYFFPASYLTLENVDVDDSCMGECVRYGQCTKLDQGLADFSGSREGKKKCKFIFLKYICTTSSFLVGQ